ncbi:MAG: (Fe-S)-binding protein [Phycisphaerae bacterium]|nr:(Fe-S)-binding protein [Phycisphaerae bacterium]
MPNNRTVALFVTCLTDQFYPRVGVAVVKILERLGWQVVFPKQQTCCGQPFFNNGYHPEAAELAKKLIAAFESYEYIVTPSGSCCAMIREHIPHLLAEDAAWASGARGLAEHTFEFVEFLDKVQHADFSKITLPAERSVTYHYTCHLRGIGMKDEGVRMLQQIGNVDFRPLEKTDQCCGFGGTFALKYPTISGTIVQDKIDCITKSGAATTICNDAGCTMNISGMCHRHGVATKVTHIAELLAEAMGIDLDHW